MKYAAGLDLGGTNIAGGIVGEDGTIAAGGSIKTHADRGPDHVIRSMGDFVLGMIEESGKEVASIGIGSPGPIDHEKGSICEAPNLHGWGETPVLAKMEEYTGYECVLENDADAACMGEKLFGAGRECDTIVHLTLGTGIGGGLFINGRLFRGGKGSGAELGHMVLNADGYRCGCGRKGCFEAYCSDAGIRTQVKEEIEGYPDSECSRFDISEINFKLIRELARKGDVYAEKVYQRVVRYFGIGIGNLVNIFNPHAVILSGGMIKAGEEFIQGIRDKVFEEAFDSMVGDCRICVSTLGDNAGVLGAAACALMNQ